MPFIDKQHREQIQRIFKDSPDIKGFAFNVYNFSGGRSRMNSGVCYIIYKLIVNVYAHGSWDQRMDAIKVLESAKDEFMKNFVRPYEDKKRQLHGDILP